MAHDKSDSSDRSRSDRGTGRKETAAAAASSDDEPAPPGISAEMLWLNKAAVKRDKRNAKRFTDIENKVRAVEENQETQGQQLVNLKDSFDTLDRRVQSLESNKASAGANSAHAPRAVHGAVSASDAPVKVEMKGFH